MAHLDWTVAFSKRKREAFSETVAFEKHERMARESLRDMVLFHAALREEMQEILAKGEAATADELEFLRCMRVVDGAYAEAMRGLREYEEDRKRHVLIAFADAAQDFMSVLYKQRKH